MQACYILENKLSGAFETFTPAEYAAGAAAGAAAGYQVIDVQPEAKIPGAKWVNLAAVTGAIPPEEIKRVKGLGCLQDKRYPDRFNVRVITRNGKITAEEQRVIAEAAERLAREYGVQFLYRDFRPNFRAGNQKARELGFYMQKYCGCVFSEEDRYEKQILRDKKRLQAE